MELKWSDLKYFRPEEFSHPDRMEPLLLCALDRAREVAGIPFVLNSTFRPGDPDSHGRGWGVDISASLSRQRFKIVHGLLLVGFHRIGVYNLHVHADLDPSLDPQVLWPGESE